MYEKGIEIFLELEKSLKEIGSRFIGSKLNIQGSLKEFSDIEEMLKQERHQFEVILLIHSYLFRHFILRSMPWTSNQMSHQ